MNDRIINILYASISKWVKKHLFVRLMRRRRNLRVVKMVIMANCNLLCRLDCREIPVSIKHILSHESCNRVENVIQEKDLN